MDKKAHVVRSIILEYFYLLEILWIDLLQPSSRFTRNARILHKHKTYNDVTSFCSTFCRIHYYILFTFCKIDLYSNTFCKCNR